MTQEEKRKRLNERHDGDQQFVELLDSVEEVMKKDGMDEDDANTVNLYVTGDMSREMVVYEVLKTLHNLK